MVFQLNYFENACTGYLRNLGKQMRKEISWYWVSVASFAIFFTENACSPEVSWSLA
jgi:hypothetical protein